MEVHPPVRSSTSYYVLVVALVGGLTFGFLMFTMTLRAPRSAARLDVAVPVAAECPSGSGAPVCYRVDVANVGSSAARIRCEVEPAADTTALFSSDSQTYVSSVLLKPRDLLGLIVKVDAGSGATVSDPPRVACVPIT